MASLLEATEGGGFGRWKAAIRRHAVWWRRICFVVIVISFLVIAWAMPMRQFAKDLEDWSRTPGLWGMTIFCGTFLLLAVLCMPTWPMPFIAGAAFGIWWGAGVASFSCIAAAAVCFVIARAAGRTKLRQYLETSPRMRALEHTVDEANWKIVAAVRVSHFLPFGMQNYAFGLTRIDFRTFLITTWAITLPGITLQAYLGNLGYASMESWQSRAATDWQTWGLRIAGVMGLAAAVFYIGYLGRSVYRKAVQKELEKELEAESRTEHEEQSWPWSSIALAACAALLVVLATTAVLARDAIRVFVERL